MEQRLSDATKQNVLLRNAIDAHLNPCGCLKGCEFCNGKYSLDEALAATADLAGTVLCDAEPVWWESASRFYDTLEDHPPEATPLYARKS